MSQNDKITLRHGHVTTMPDDGTRRCVVVSRRCVEQRLARLFAKRGNKLVRGRGANAGRYFVVSDQAGIKEAASSLAALADEYGTLKPWETLGSEP